MVQLELFPPTASSPATDFDYTVRKSKRAKHVSIKISVDGTVEVVVPPTFNRKKLHKPQRLTATIMLASQRKV